MVDLPVTAALYPTPDEVHAQLLSDLRYGYDRLGVAINVKKDSELYVRTKAVANRLSLAIANGAVGLRNTSPLTATGDALTTWAATFGVTARPATSAAGFANVVVVAPAVTITVPINYQFTSSAGIKYQTTAATLVTNGDPVPVQAINTGADTDLAAAAIVTWDSAAVAFLGQKATIAAGGIDGGADADTEEEVRARLIRKLSFPAIGGNWGHVVELAEGASAAVNTAYVYPTARGPASYDVAVMGDDDDPVLNSSAVDQVAAAIVAEMPGSANLNATTIVEETIDVIINTSLPLPVHAGGDGTGWHDASPWPTTADIASLAAQITAVDAAADTITVNSTAADPPTVGARFAIWNPTTEAMVEFAVAAVTAFPYTITIDSAFSNQLSFVTTFMYCSAGAMNLNAYAQSYLAAIKALGPGEKTTNPDILIYARRKPPPSLERPAIATTRLLNSMINDHSEISDLSYAARYDAGTVVTRTTPSVPATTAGAPRKLVLQSLSFRRQV